MAGTLESLTLTALLVLALLLAGCQSLPQKQVADADTGALLYIEERDGKLYATDQSHDAQGNPLRELKEIDARSIETAVASVGSTAAGWLPFPFNEILLTLSGLGAVAAGAYIRKRNGQVRAGEELVLKIEGDPAAKAALKEQADKHSPELKEFVAGVTRG